MQEGSRYDHHQVLEVAHAIAFGCSGEQVDPPVLVLLQLCPPSSPSYFDLPARPLQEILELQLVATQLQCKWASVSAVDAGDLNEACLLSRLHCMESGTSAPENCSAVCSFY